MAYPGEQTHKEYLDYLIDYDSGNSQGPRLTKEEWIKQRKAEEADRKSPPKSEAELRDTIAKEVWK